MPPTCTPMKRVRNGTSRDAGGRAGCRQSQAMTTRLNEYRRRPIAAPATRSSMHVAQRRKGQLCRLARCRTRATIRTRSGTPSRVPTGGAHGYMSTTSGAIRGSPQPREPVGRDDAASTAPAPTGYHLHGPADVHRLPPRRRPLDPRAARPERGRSAGTGARRHGRPRGFPPRARRDHGRPDRAGASRGTQSRRRGRRGSRPRSTAS